MLEWHLSALVLFLAKTVELWVRILSRSHTLLKYFCEGLRYSSDHAKYFLYIVAMMIPFFQMFAGGPLGTGQQW